MADYDSLQPGDHVIVTTRGNIRATVVKKFKSQSASTTKPAGTEYVEVETSDGSAFFNYPSQLEVVAGE